MLVRLFMPSTFLLSLPLNLTLSEMKYISQASVYFVYYYVDEQN